MSVCDTIAYAHNRGIIHRDLKPGNIMLGPYGETLVVDWGLAKPVGRSSGEKEPPEGAIRPVLDVGSNSPTLGPVGTLRFMSPEQAAGDGDHEVGPASDIYSLGATLFCLLTGKPPIQGKGDSDSIRAKVRAGDFPRPRALHRNVPAPLEAVCLKAMALRPEERYPGARALGNDIERWLADEPVSAHTEPMPVRLGRWCRRHRPLVAGAAVALVAAVVALGVDWFRVGRERRRAENNFALARAAVDRILTEIAEGQLAAVPQAEELRLQVAKDALEFNERFLREQPRNPEVRRDAARVYREVANIQRTLGLFTESIQAYAKAIALRERLAAEPTSLDDDRANLALTLADTGESYLLAGKLQEGERLCRAGLSMANQLVKASPSTPNAHIPRALGLLNLASIQLEQRRYDDAASSAKEAAAEFRGLVGSPINRARNLLLLDMAHETWGEALRQSGRLAESEVQFTSVIRATSRIAR